MTANAPAQQDTAKGKMRAIVQERYGPPGALRLREVDRPALPEDGVLVRVRASSVNRAEWYGVTGTPYFARAFTGLIRPKQSIPGVDFAGVVEAVGSAVTRFRPGDEVFGGRNGALAEYLTVRKNVVHKPANVTFEEAASVPTAAITALQGLRDHGQVRPGQKVLVNGAAGGVGTFAVQIAKALGAHVTAVCSTRNVELARTLGADRVIDYTREDFTRGGERYDLLLDVAGGRPWSALRRVLERGARLVLVGGPMGNPVLGPVGHLLRVRLASLGASQKVVFFIAKFTPEDLLALGQMLEAGRIKPVIDRRYTLAEVPEALGYIRTGHARGKVVITV